MTAKTDLLPMPKGEAVGMYQAWSYDQMQAYARANVAVATAMLQAEIEALRAEVEEWKDAARCASEQQDSLFWEARALNERADKLRAEVGTLRRALSRILENEASDYKAAEEFGGYVLDDELREEARAALAKEGER